VLDAWRSRAASTLGRRVEWDDGGIALAGVVADIDEDGGLVVETIAGVARIVSGAVRWR
jgi:biotin-(acetyl-CoA carboxylase) ligase